MAHDGQEQRDQEGARPAPRRPGEGVGDDSEFALIVRDALDAAREIATDSAELAKMEVKQVSQKFKEDALHWAPRILWGAVASVFVMMGAGLSMIAAFIAAGAIIPSIPVRLFLLAAFCFALSLTGAKKLQRKSDRKPRGREPQVKGIVPLYPRDGIGE